MVALLPLESNSNRFVDLFGMAIADRGFQVKNFRWKLSVLAASDVAIMHWPNEFFTRPKPSQVMRLLTKLLIINIAKRVYGTRFVWVAHNAAPHDEDGAGNFASAMFLRSLDGVIYLSDHSREVIGRHYPKLRTKPSLATVHGHYRDVAATAIVPFCPPQGDFRLAYVGQIRPYKNLEALVEAAAVISSGLHLTISGHVVPGAKNRAVADAIAGQAKDSPHIELDLRDEPLSEPEFEAGVDVADAVVLPYRNILHSGAAIFALSRNRPVLAPRQGSLPQIQETVGSDWLYLYEGDFSAKILADFLAWLRHSERGAVAPMEAFDWPPIGRDLARFIDDIAVDRRAAAPLATTRRRAG